MREENKKIVMVSYICLAAIAAVTTNVIFETFAAAFGFVAVMYAQDIFKHGLPILASVSVLAYLLLSKKMTTISDEVVTETKKVVWPSRKDTSAMTVVVCVMLIISSIILFTMDFLSREIVSMILS